MSGETAVKPGADRRFYVVAALVALLLVLTGFARTYYLKGYFSAPALTLLQHVHGVIMTTWFLLFVVQTWLVATRRVAAHRRLGVFGAVLAGLVVVVGVAIAIHGARRGASPGPPPLVFLAVPLGDVAVFAALVGTALWLRSSRETHRRLMLVATLSILPAAVGRLPITPMNPLVFFGIPDLCILVALAYDTWRHRRLHPAFLWGAIVVIASHPLRLLLSGTETWMRLATWITA